MRNLRSRLKALRRYPSLVVGLTIIGLLLVLSIYTVTAIPYSDAIRLWRVGQPEHAENPRNASPVWWDWFTRDRLPRTFEVTSEEHGLIRIEDLDGEMSLVEISLPFTYDYDRFPKELIFTAWVPGVDQRIPVSIWWETAAQETIMLHEERLVRLPYRYNISQDTALTTRLARPPQMGLFDNPEDRDRSLAGDYQLVMRAEVPRGSEVGARLLVLGQVHGPFGTDHVRRDLTVAMLWGAPIGLVFGVLAAVGAQLSTFVLGAIGTWFGGKVDNVFRRLTELTMILPLLPILIVIGHFYTRSLWAILGVLILLNIFSASYMVYRSMFLQLKEAPYLEAAQAYGAGNWRIIFRYLLPRMMPVLLPSFVLLIPSFVFLEASLAMLGLGDPQLPTWGKLIYDARVQGALYLGYYYWVLQPAALLMLIGFGFSLVGFTLDRIVNPRLRTV